MTTPIKKRNVGHLTRITHLNKSGYFTWKLLRILYLDDLDVPIKKNKNRKNERDEIMAVIRKNPEDFGVRRSSRGPPTLSESSNDDDGSSSDSSEDFKPIKK